VENWDASHPTWIEKPSQVVASIRRFMSRPVFALDEAQPRLTAFRERAEKEVLSRVREDKRQEFAKLMKAAQWSSIVDEEHPFYTENYGNALARRVTKEIGKRFAATGMIDDPQDVYYLLPEEISVRILGRYPAHDLVARRKEEHAAFAGRNPTCSSGHHQDWRSDREQPHAPQHSAAPAPGEARAQGRSLWNGVHPRGGRRHRPRVAFRRGLRQVRARFGPGDGGDFFVWTPLFNIAAAVITDVGGILSHSAILGREYGLRSSPAASKAPRS